MNTPSFEEGYLRHISYILKLILPKLIINILLLIICLLCILHTNKIIVRIQEHTIETSNFFLNQLFIIEYSACKDKFGTDQKWRNLIQK